MIASIFENNKAIVFFLYGAVFFLMGVAILFKHSDTSQFRLARNIHALAAFGILHGFSEWGVIFIPIQETYLDDRMVLALYTFGVILKSASFAFLFYFGARLLADTQGRYRQLPLVPIFIFLLWLTYLFFLLLWLFPKVETYTWLSVANAWSRYLLALPGALLTAHALWLQREELQALQEPKINAHLLRVRVSFVFYALWGGLVVPFTPFAPASWLNQNLIFNIFGIPVAVFRALTGLAMFYYTLRLLEVFHIENDRRAKALEHLELLVSERERIARDLHDGVIQNLYAAGLLLDDLGYELKDSHIHAHQDLDMIKAALDNTMQDLRNYIFDLLPNNLQDPNLKQGLGRLLQEVEVHSLLVTNLRWEGPVVNLPATMATNFYLIAKEALHNIIKHACAHEVLIVVASNPNSIKLVIEDDGIGYETGQQEQKNGQGLKNMYERAQLLDGKLEIITTLGQGTRIGLHFPLPSLVNWEG